MKEILIWLGVTRRPYQKINLQVTFKTTLPTNQPSFQQWCKEFQVSMLHGRMPVNM